MSKRIYWELPKRSKIAIFIAHHLIPYRVRGALFLDCLCWVDHEMKIVTKKTKNTTTSYGVITGSELEMLKREIFKEDLKAELKGGKD
jgi:hypothetical protein